MSWLGENRVFFHYRKTPTSSSNVLFALMGVVCSSLLSPTGSSETQTGKHAAARSCTEFLLLTITHIQCVIKGSEVEHSVNSPVSILLSVRHISLWLCPSFVAIAGLPLSYLCMHFA